nr:unnamed protein product [Callosobruchus chinensis]
MKLVKQSTTFNIEKNTFQDNYFKRHGELFPSTIRCIILGPSNCGKTNVMINLIEHENGLRFRNVYVFSKSLNQPKYLYLEQLLKPIKNIQYFGYNASENILHPSEAKQNSIFIFDDVACDNQDVIREYFSMGRHNKIDSFYLCQTYAKIPKHRIRDNTNCLILFKQDDLNLRHTSIYNDHVGSDMNFNQFKQICALCWKDFYGFLTICKDNDIDKGRYRKTFDHFIHF